MTHHSISAIQSIFVLAALQFTTVVIADDKKSATPKPEAPPVAADPRLVVELFAAAPDIVQPIAADFDSKGRLLVVESHTHFRPAKYDGPKFDRIRVLEDTDGDGKADKFTTFFEGTTHTMDVAVHPDGSVYVATRNEILRLRDTKGNGEADEKVRIAFLDTAGNYPHNGLSGLSFDSKGNLNFGMGENLGADYKLIGADGKTLTGGGEGGNVFWCTADGKNLRRVATGFWNPFGSCRDIFGRLFVVDDDPDSSPPCRMLHIVEGADYGFQFRYGRAGRHPFQAWNGELPGTLPYAAGTGQSPCEVISYESDGLPKEYLGNLLMPIWADHRVERYVPRAQGATIVGDRKPFIQGGKEFRPSGMAVAPDGSLFVSDWVSASYELHGKGAVWHVRWKDRFAHTPGEGLNSQQRSRREALAQFMAHREPGREILRTTLSNGDVRARAAALTALIDANDKEIDLATVAKKDAEPAIRAMAVRGLIARNADVTAFADDSDALVRVEAIAGLGGESSLPKLLKLLADPDPFIRHAAVQSLGTGLRISNVDRKKLTDPKHRVGLLLALREVSARRPSLKFDVDIFLADSDADVRFMAMKWVSDEKLVEYRPKLVEMLKDPALDPRAFIGLTTALARLDNKPVNEDSLADYYLDRLADKSAPSGTRQMALRSVPATHPKLKLEALTDFLKHDDPAFRIEALRALKDRGDAKSTAFAREIGRDQTQPVAVRAQALMSLGTQADADFLVVLATIGERPLRAEAIRSLTGLKLTDEQRILLSAVPVGDLTDRVLGKSFFADRPPQTDTDAWLKRLEGPADAEAGRRIFEHPKLTGCYKCHRVDGRGADVGPDLSLAGRTEKRWIVESILQPAASVAPHYQPWKVDTLDGRSRTGLLIRTYLDECTYVDAKGEQFKVLATEVAETNLTRGSIMPDKLVDQLTDQEIRDLVAYLLSRK